MKIYTFLFITILSIVAGCTPLPDVSSFVTSTNELCTAVVTAGNIVQEELKEAQRELTREDIEQNQKKVQVIQGQADALHTAWTKRENMMKAMSTYAQSLQAIVNSGNQGAKSAGKVIDAVSQFAETIGHPIPMSEPAIEIASESMKLIAKHMALAKAARSLQESLSRIQPAVEELSKLMVQDLRDLDDSFRLANKLVENIYESRDENQKLLGYRDFLKKTLYDMNSFDVSSDKVKLDVKASKFLEATQPLHENYEAELRIIQDRSKAGRMLIIRTQSALQEWAIAHQNLVIAVSERKPVDIQSILTASLEIRRLIEKIQEL